MDSSTESASPHQYIPFTPISMISVGLNEITFLVTFATRSR